MPRRESIPVERTTVSASVRATSPPGPGSTSMSSYSHTPSCATVSLPAVTNRCAGAVGRPNSSTLPSSLMEDCVRDPSRLLNVHFFNPPLVMSLVEVVKGAHTSDETVHRAMEFSRSIGKTPVLVSKEAYGFIANRILFIAMQEAMRLVQEGYVSVEDCDLALHNALGWPMGPFALADLVGLDVVEAILAEGATQTGDDRWAPLPLLRDRVQRGELGRKTGRGFTAF